MCKNKKHVLISGSGYTKVPKFGKARKFATFWKPKIAVFGGYGKYWCRNSKILVRLHVAVDFIEIFATTLKNIPSWVGLRARAAALKIDDIF